MLIKKRWIKILSPFALIALGAVCFFTLQARTQHHSMITTPVQVLVTHPTPLSITGKVSVIASISAKQQTYIMPKTAGYISKVFFEEGEYVKAGAPLVQLDTTKVRAQLVAEQTALNLTKRQYDSDLGLYKRGLIAKMDRDTDHTKYADDLAVVTADQKLLDQLTLRAPFSGTLGAKNLNVGDYVAAAQKLVLLVDRNHLLAEYNLPEKYYPAIKLGEPITLKSDLFPKEVFSGTIEYIAPDINSNTRTIDVHATINDSKHQLLPGQFVTVKQPLSKTQRILFVPEQSVLESLQGASVFVIEKGKAKKVSVHLGIRKKGMVAIMSGLTAKDVVITEGQHSLQEGQVVSAEKATKPVAVKPV